MMELHRSLVFVTIFLTLTWGTFPCSTAQIFSRIQLLQLGYNVLNQQTPHRISPEAYHICKDLGILHARTTRRGTKGGRHHKAHGRPDKSTVTTATGSPNISPTNESLHFALLNAHSICKPKKAPIIAEYIRDEDIDIVALTETWLKSDGKDQIAEGDICPEGYSFIQVNRKDRRGGGVAILHKSNIKLVQVQTTCHRTFELIEARIIPKMGEPTLCCVVYRPPPSLVNELTPHMFYDEFKTYLEQKVILQDQLLICGDFNFHVDDLNDHHANLFMDLITSFDLKQHINVPTQCKGHTLDIIITRANEDFIKDNVYAKDMGKEFSDHYWIHAELTYQKPDAIKKEIEYRKLKDIDTDKFRNDICNSLLAKPENFNNVDSAVHAYNHILSELLEKHAPLKKRSFTVRKDAAWFTSEIGDAKRARRKAERLYRRTKLTVHREMFLEAQHHVNKLIENAKLNYYKAKVNEAPDQKSMFKVVDSLLHRKQEPKLPSHENPKELAERFCDFFVEKIMKIRKELFDKQGSASKIGDNTVPASVCWSSFKPVSEDDVKKIIESTKSNSCSQDPIPTTLLKKCLGPLLPFITKVVNLSLSDGVMPSNLKKALLLPLLKKNDLDAEILKHFRPISNLTYLSKLIERIVAKQLQEHIRENNLDELYQSAYKKFHSCETALLRVQNDILKAIDNDEYVLLVLLDLSAAFDTIDHKTLLNILGTRLGITGTVLKWFHSYLTERTQAVVINGIESELVRLLFGVPQGSVLGPILFTIYTSPLGTILREMGIMFHLYADDTQLYLSFKLQDCKNAVKKMEQCVDVIKDWMANNFLKLNADKTEVLYLGKPSMLKKLEEPRLLIGSDEISHSDSARNIGAIFVNTMQADKQIGQICKGAWNQLRNIGKIRSFLNPVCTERLVHAFVTSKLDNMNCLLYGSPQWQLDKLQRVLNSAARIITHTKKSEHISPVLMDLHWLPICQRINYKILLLTYKSLHGKAPSYLKDLLSHKKVTTNLRSNDKGHLMIPKSNSARYGDRAFCHVAPTLWNALPQHIRDCRTVDSFKKVLKTHLFKQAYYA